MRRFSIQALLLAAITTGSLALAPGVDAQVGDPGTGDHRMSMTSSIETVSSTTESSFQAALWLHTRLLFTRFTGWESLSVSRPGIRSSAVALRERRAHRPIRRFTHRRAQCEIGDAAGKIVGREELLRAVEHAGREQVDLTGERRAGDKRRRESGRRSNRPAQHRRRPE